MRPTTSTAVLPFALAPFLRLAGGLYISIDSEWAACLLVPRTCFVSCDFPFWFPFLGVAYLRRVSLPFGPVVSLLSYVCLPFFLLACLGGWSVLSLFLLLVLLRLRPRLYCMYDSDERFTLLHLLLPSFWLLTVHILTLLRATPPPPFLSYPRPTSLP